MLIKFEKGNSSGVEAQNPKFYRVGEGEGPSGQSALWTSDLEPKKVGASLKEEVGSTEEENRSTLSTSDSSVVC